MQQPLARVEKRTRVGLRDVMCRWCTRREPVARLRVQKRTGGTSWGSRLDSSGETHFAWGLWAFLTPRVVRCSWCAACRKISACSRRTSSEPARLTRCSSATTSSRSSRRPWRGTPSFTGFIVSPHPSPRPFAPPRRCLPLYERLAPSGNHYGARARDLLRCHGS